jgi:hypothetical protein
MGSVALADKLIEVGLVRTTFHGGQTENGRIEFYEYSRSSYALARLIGTVESFRRTGIVPKRISGSANVEIFTTLPEAGSWTFVTNLWRANKTKVALDIDFNGLFSWATGKALDNMDLYNSNSDAILKNKEAVQIDLAETMQPRRRKRRVAIKPESAGDPANQPKKLTKSSLKASQKTQESEKANRISLETDIAVARQVRKNLSGSPATALEEARRAVEAVEGLASSSHVRMFSEEEALVQALSQYADQVPANDRAAAERAARIAYAASDLAPRLSRRLLGDRFVPEEIGTTRDDLDELSAKARPLIKEIVLPLRKSPEEMDVRLGAHERRIVHIDEVRGRMISESILSRDVFIVSVFVIEYNRVTHSGRCRIDNLGLDVPFSLRRELIGRLEDAAIDALREEEIVFHARSYLDDDGAIRSLLVEDIEQ